jgi:hypothetical protein
MRRYILLRGFGGRLEDRPWPPWNPSSQETSPTPIPLQVPTELKRALKITTDHRYPMSTGVPLRDALNAAITHLSVSRIRLEEAANNATDDDIADSALDLLTSAWILETLVKGRYLTTAMISSILPGESEIRLETLVWKLEEVKHLHPST